METKKRITHHLIFNMEKPTKEKIRKYLEEIFYKQINKKERKVYGLRGCLTYGWVEFSTELTDGPIACSDPNCPGCAMFNKMLQEEAKKFTDGV